MDIIKVIFKGLFRPVFKYSMVITVVSISRWGRSGSWGRCGSWGRGGSRGGSWGRSGCRSGSRSCWANIQSGRKARSLIKS
jgi:hypothetical protein